jgi:phosphatidylglycerophosphatase A
VESKATVRGLQAVLRRLKFLAPGIRTVSGAGIDPDVLAKALAREELTPAASEADAEILWQPGGRAESESTARAVAIVAAAIATPPLPHQAVERPAQTYIPLRDWVNGWFAPGSALAKILVPLLVSPAVGDRPTRVPLTGSREWIFTREPAGATEERGAGWKMALVSGFGCGFFPLMPATLACVVMTPVALALYLLGGWAVLFSVAAVVFLASTIASVALEKWAGRQLLADDPREFVLDEYAGMALTWMFLPPGAPWWFVLVGFFLFRIFDIFKWGVHWVEELPIPGKIVWDDVLAGLYAGVVLWALCRVF